MAIGAAGWNAPTVVAVQVQHIDLWRADLNTLNPHDGTEPWIYSVLAGFLAGGDGATTAPNKAAPNELRPGRSAQRW